MPLDRRDPALEIALDRQWDTVLVGTSSDSNLEVLAPELDATFRHASALDDVAAPHPAFASTLWDDLMHASGNVAVPPVTPPTASALSVRPTAPIARSSRCWPALRSSRSIHSCRVALGLPLFAP
jgi:hypothetical protein